MHCQDSEGTTLYCGSCNYYVYSHPMRTCRAFSVVVIAGCLIASGVSPSAGIAQGSAGSDGKVEPRFLVDIPTAGLLDRGSFAFDANFFQEGGVLVGLTAGVLDRLNFGISYGGTKIIGAEDPAWNKTPGVSVKFRLFDESDLIPAIAIGYDSQGKEAYIDSLDRYTIKSPGFFATASKNYAILGYLSIHGGINYSLERVDGDKDMNVFVGVEKTIGTDISVMLENDFAFNDSRGRALGSGKGYMNFGGRWSLGSGFTIGLDLKDVRKNQRHVTIGKRAIRLEYVKFF
jgi:hypothetical protein